ncbi:MAG: hypothetical protein JW871_05360 [Endomicrobiales bacterium]|nr:hypothetical protein [Endomicrobiales bacterium]
MNENIEIKKEEYTPNSIVFGWLILVFGSIPLIMGIGEKRDLMLLIGTIMELIAVIMLIVGYKRASQKEVIKNG